MYVTAEPFAAVFIAIGCSFMTMFMRTFWRVWSMGAVLSFIGAVIFLPSLWWLASSVVLLPFLMFGISQFRFKAPTIETNYQPLESSDVSLTRAMTPRAWLQLGLLQLFFFASTTAAMLRILNLPSPISEILNIDTWNLVSLNFSTILHFFKTLMRHADFHTTIAVCLIFTQMIPHGRLGRVNRNTALVFLTMLAVQFSISSVLSGANESFSSARGILFESTAKSIEPLFFGWTTGAGWRLLDHLTGYRLSNAGWSIRGRSRT